MQAFHFKNTNSSSETTRAIPFQLLSKPCSLPFILPTPLFYSEKNQFNQWLAGLIDGHGCLLLSKKGYGSVEITLHEKEYRLLYNIKKRFHGKVSLRKGAKAVRWRLHNKEGLMVLLQSINGFCRTLIRKKQLSLLCSHYGITFKETNAFSRNSSWYSGFFEAEGRFNFNSKNLQLTIAIGQKEILILNEIKKAFGGKVYYDKSWNGWVYNATSLKDLEPHFRYFSKFPMGSWKQIQLVRFKRLSLFKQRKYHLLARGRKLDRFSRLVKTFVEEKGCFLEKVKVKNL